MKKHTNVRAIDDSKRLFFKGMLLGAGALAFAKFVPLAKAMNAATIPPVNSLILDDQCSVGGGCENTNVSFQLEFEDAAGSNTVDVDLEMITPGGTRIAPKAQNGVLSGNCGFAHQGDEISGGSVAIERISNSPSGRISAGRYQLFARPNSPNVQLTLNLRFSGCRTGNSATVVRSIGEDISPFDIGSVNISAGGTPTIRLFSPPMPPS